MLRGSKKIVLLYFLISSIWIYASDVFFESIFNSFSIEKMSQYSTLKGLFFVSITALLLYKLINQYYKTVKRSEEEYKAMFDQNPNPMWIYKKDSLEFLKVNKAAINKYGYSEAEFLKMKATDIRPADEVDKFKNHIKNHGNILGNVGIWKHQLKNKNIVFVDGYLYDIIYNKLDARIVLLLDVTDKIKYEKQLEENQKVLELTNEKLEDTVKELQLSKEQIASTQKIAKIGGWRYYIEDNRFEFTPSFYEVINVASAGNSFNSISDLELFICDEDLYKLREFTNNIKNGDKHDECILRVKYGDKWRFIKFGALLSPNSDVLEGFIQDITRLELKDQLIKSTLERFEQFSIATNNAIYEWDYSTDVLRWTGNVSNFILDAEVEFIDKRQWWKERMHPEDFQKNYDFLQVAIANREESLKREYRFLTNGGEYKRLYDQSMIKYDDNQKVMKIIGSISDIEEVTRVNKENKRLGEIVNKVKNLVIISDKEGCIEWVNRAFLRKFSLKWEEVVGKKPWNLFSYPKSSEKHVEEIKNSILNEKYFNLEVENIINNSERCWFQIDGSPIYDEQNKCVGYISIESDITERKIKEDQIQRQNKVLKEAAWINSHEVRKPLASILGLIQLMQLSENESEYQEYLSLLEICSKELDGLIHKAVNLVDLQ